MEKPHDGSQIEDNQHLTLKGGTLKIAEGERFPKIATFRPSFEEPVLAVKGAAWPRFPACSFASSAERPAGRH
jgi:hypothetical protein